MEQLHGAGVGEKFLKVGRVVAIALEFHEMRIAVAGRKLHEAEPVAVVLQPHRLGIDGDVALKFKPVGQVAFMQVNGNGRAP